jgi:hypothetical protein
VAVFPNPPNAPKRAVFWEGFGCEVPKALVADLTLQLPKSGVDGGLPKVVVPNPLVDDEAPNVKGFETESVEVWPEGVKGTGAWPDEGIEVAKEKEGATGATTLALGKVLDLTEPPGVRDTAGKEGPCETSIGAELLREFEDFWSSSFCTVHRRLL